MTSMWMFLGLLLVGITGAQESQCQGAVLEDRSGTEVRWTYDESHGTCRMILQKDSTSIVNIFRTEKDCLKTCTQTYSSLYPAGDAVCNLTKDPGPCMALALMWYYDMEQKVCNSFFYGGCQGNGNRFNDKEECIDRCVPAKKGKSGAAQEAEASGEEVDAGLIIGVVFGIIFGAAFLVTLGLYLVQRKKMKQQKHTRVPDAEMK